MLIILSLFFFNFFFQLDVIFFRGRSFEDEIVSTISGLLKVVYIPRFSCFLTLSVNFLPSLALTIYFQDGRFIVYYDLFIL